MDVLTDTAIHHVLSMSEAISALYAGYTCYDGADHNPPRTLLRVGEQGATFGVMPYYSMRDNLFIVKVVSHHVFNRRRGRKSINGLIVVQDGATGEVKAQLDAATITALRTGATAGLATDLLARKNSKTLAVIGTGDQAAAALDAVLCVRDIGRVAVYSRSKDNVGNFIDHATEKYGRRMVFHGCEDARAALCGADIVCTATTCAEPLFSADDVAQGVHVNAIGKHTPVSREFPLELVPRSILLVEDREAAIREAGGYHRHAISIPEMLQAEQGEYQSQTTIFSSVGTAFQDACICVAILKKLQLLKT
ncbi:ornithine cyclodeaminase family protein [Pseudomonas libanensis]|uniref:ornithine cyclodeaminase family protein n=1 Tax=Pseudomonas libanensis TaxID=75588 RepID=UPI000750C108|nr:hypothetical protein [Pseudomonas libanensis]